MVDYLNVIEVESAMEMAELMYPGFVKRIKLPLKTHEDRTCHFVKISKDTGQKKIGVYFIGGVHGSEWTPPDALIYFMESLSNAYQTNSEITIGSNIFSASEIKRIISRLEIFVFPQVNPDSRHVAQTNNSESLSNRKNRRPNEDGTIGVDINRNFDICWYYPNYMSPATRNQNGNGLSASLSPNSRTYIGPAPNSEPETRNVVHVLRSNPQIKFFIDVHSYSELILFNWGIDETQTTAPQQNFRNISYDGQRGVANDSYAEYMDPESFNLNNRLAHSMISAIRNVNGRNYSAQLPYELYPTVGTSADYITSRSFAQPSVGSLHGFTIECATRFMPETTALREGVIEEVTSGLIKFCLDILELSSSQTLIKTLILEIEVGREGVRGQDAAGTSHLLGDLHFTLGGIDSQVTIEMNNIGTEINPNWRGWGTGNHSKIYELTNPIPIDNLNKLVIYMPAAGGLFGDNADINRVTVKAVSVDNGLCVIGEHDTPFRLTGNNERVDITIDGCL